MSSSIIALIALILASIFWSSAGVVSKTLLRDFDPFALGFLRFLIASICIAPWILTKRLNFKKLIRDTFLISLCGAGNIAFFYFGLRLTTANAAQMIYASTPLVVAILSRLLINERLTRQKISGILIGFLGVLIITILPIFEKGQMITGNILGNILISVAVICWSLYTIGSRYLIIQKKYSAVQVSGMSFAVITLVFCSLMIIFPQRTFIPSLGIIKNISLLVYLALMVTVVTFLLYQWSIQHSSATTASFTTYLQPLFAFLLNAVFLGEQITPLFIGGSTLVFIGIFITTGNRVWKGLFRLRAYFK